MWAELCLARDVALAKAGLDATNYPNEFLELP